ncbi:MAG TPA: hypothetical protein VK168_17750 [Saprospiraceae bacterium]|nr:hypothetical protein [Saprospiraceae bacterium]
MQKSLLLFIALFQATTACQSSPNPVAMEVGPKPLTVSYQQQPSNRSKIQVALLLDTSNSMDGLIDQAKAQLWKMVNRLADAQRQQVGVELEIALYEYGNSGLDDSNGFIRLVQPMSTDLDGLSEKLFQLSTNGGDEYCGWVIKTSLKDIQWSANDNDLRIIVIAGNEPFNQGPVDPKNSCGTAKDRGILVNTIYCGDYETGVASGWKEGADMGKGKYMIIDTNKKVVHISTPYDGRVLELNEKLNKTYIGYGKEGEAKKMRQSAQDANASQYGSSNFAQRAAAKSKASYRNEDWDIVDAANSDRNFLDKLEESALPAEFKGKTKPEIKKEIERLSKERDAIKKELAEQEKMMALFIAEETSKKAGSSETLDNVLINAVVEQAKAKGFSFPEMK